MAGQNRLETGTKHTSPEKAPQSEFHVRLFGHPREYLQVIQDGYPHTIGFQYYEDCDPINLLQSDIIPTERGFQIVTQVNPYYEEIPSIDFQPLIMALSKAYELKLVHGFPVFQSRSGTQFILENSLHNGLRIMVNGKPEVAEVRRILNELVTFLATMIYFAYNEYGALPSSNVYELDLKTRQPKTVKAESEVKKASPEPPSKKAEKPVWSLSPIEPKHTFHDIVGNREIVRSMMALARAIADPQRREQLGVELPPGILLVGPPGTGKTLMIEALANQARCRFVLVDSSFYIGGLVGDLERNIQTIFNDAKGQLPGVFSIIFFDDLDLLFSARGHSTNEYRTAAMNQMLGYVGGATAGNNYLVVAATNRKDNLDPALYRAGRFGSRVFTFELPTFEERKQVLRLHVQRLERKARRKIFGRLHWDELATVSEDVAQAELAAALEQALFQVNEQLLLDESRRKKPMLVNHAMVVEALAKQKDNQEEVRETGRRQRRRVGFRPASLR